MKKVSKTKMLAFVVMIAGILSATSCQKEFLITAMPDDGSHGTVNGGGVYKEGSVIEIWAVPATGYRFERWDDGYTDNPRTITVTGNATYIAIFSGGVFTDAFSVSATRTVYFSPGNLQWSATNGGSSPTYHPVAGGYGSAPGTWRFAPNQWDIIGIENRYIDSAYTGWIDLFGWGTSGWNSGNTYYHPWDSNDDSIGLTYGPPGEYNLTGSYANADWGVYNPISNGGNIANQWRTLTNEEWQYVFSTRTTTSGIRYAKAKVNNINGVILLPDDWSSSTYSLSNTNNSGASFSSNTISASQWTTLESAGAVFLPAAGFRHGASVGNVGSLGCYWSASYDGSDGAYYVIFDDSGLGANYGIGRSYGRSVRLVCPAE